jgi:hypothetical protein
MTVTDAPTRELGSPGGIAPTYGSAIGGADSYYVEGLEVNVDLRFPASAIVYDRMRKEDGQVGSVARAITYPILGAKRRLVGGRPEVRAFVERELGLDTLGEDELGRRRRRREGIVLHDHIREALLSLWFGFMPFEQVYEVGPAAPGLEDPEQPGRLYAHLRKLAPRMPRTVSEVRVHRDGGLAGIVQHGLAGTRGIGMGTHGDVFIPVDNLVMYVNEREGADWHGNSLLRAAYKHWLIKDALIRLGAQIVERNGMGIPFVSYDDDSLRTKALELAKALRAGAEAGGALPKGMTVSIVGVSGSTADELPRVKYHDESIGRSLLAMFLNLGHDNGARALGATFVDYFLLAVNSIIRNIDETITEHIIRDLVELNYGADEAYPVLRSDDLTAEATPTAEALKALADAGLLTHDRELEADIRRRYRLPVKPEPVGEQALEDTSGNPFASVGIPALIDAGVITPDEGRQMLKLPGTAPGAPPEPGAAPIMPTEDDVVELPVAMAENLSAFRGAIRLELGVDRVEFRSPYEPATVIGDPLVAQLAALADRITALRLGHSAA